MVTHKTKTESTKEKVARLRRKRLALEQDKKDFGYFPDLDEEEVEEMEWLAEHEEAMAEMRAEYYEEKRRGII